MRWTGHNFGLSRRVDIGYLFSEEVLEEASKSGDSSLHDWFNKSKSSDGKPGWVQLGGKYIGKLCQTTWSDHETKVWFLQDEEKPQQG